ncbi:MAG: VCBS repeat-containing protein, partial [Ignavibacteria bacterium]|nr:VCBS repeat-containing protein [Ignavibacteria bacterium]
MKLISGFIFSIILLSSSVANSQSFTKITSGAIVNDGGWSYGCCWADFNNDGKQDLFVCNNQTGNKNNMLYLNNGDGTFAKVTTGAVVTDGGSSYGCTAADYDNNGTMDLFVSNYGENNFLCSGNGGGSFTKITTGSIVNDGGNSTGCAWAD